MLTRVSVAPYTISGVSVGGVYTSLLVPELDAIFDVGVSPLSFVGAGHLFLSHAHADHIGALPSLIGVRGLAHRPAPRTFVPAEVLSDLEEGVAAFSRGQRRPVEVPFVPMKPGDEFHLTGDLWVRAVRTLHTVPSLGYVLFRRVNKLKEEFLVLGPEAIRERRAAGVDLFRTEERRELAYVTDTLIDVLDQNVELYSARVLILECTFLDERKSAAETRKKCHIHLDEIIERAELFDNEHLVLMHFSQAYQPREVHEILKRRLPSALAGRVKAFAPQKGPWPG